MPIQGEFNVKKGELHEKEALKEIHVSSAHTNNPGLFSAYRARPSGIKFSHQDKDENIILFLRRHFITNLGWITGALTASLIPLAVTAFFSISAPGITLSPIAGFIVVAFYYLVIFGYLLVNFSIWFFHVGIVTNKRIIDMDVTSILIKNVNEIRIDDILDVGYTQVGTLRSLLNYGDVKVQTEGVAQNFEFDATPRPNEVSRIIADLADAARDKHHDTN